MARQLSFGTSTAPSPHAYSTVSEASPKMKPCAIGFVVRSVIFPLGCDTLIATVVREVPSHVESDLLLFLLVECLYWRL